MELQKHKVFIGHQAAIYAIAASFNSNHFYTGGSDKIIVEWNVENENEGVLIANASDVVYCFQRLNENLLLASTAKGEIHVIDVIEKKEIKLIKLCNDALFNISHYSQFNFLFALSATGDLYILSDKDFSLVKKFKLSSVKLRAIVFNNHIAIIGCGEGKIHLIDLNILEHFHSEQIHEINFSVNALDIYKNKIYAGSRDAFLKVYDMEKLKITQEIPAHNYALYAIKLNQTKNILASCSRDKSIKIWDLESLEFIQKVDSAQGGHINSVNNLLWLNDETLISVGDDRAVIAWKLH